MAKLFLIIFYPFYLMASNCSPLNWVGSPLLSEEYEWFFFKGQAADQYQEDALIKARGLALERLNQNCDGIPLDTKFLRKCLEPVGGGFQAYVQVGISKKSCFQIKQAKLSEKEKLSNKVLGDDFKFFFEKLVKRHIPKNYICNPLNTELCKDKGAYFFDLGNYPKALESLEYACEAADLRSCILGGFSFFLLKEYNASLNFFRRTCQANDAFGCLFLGFIYQEIKNSRLAKNNFQKSCFLGNPRGCLHLGELTQNSGTVLKLFYEACLMNSNDGCGKLFSILSPHSELSEVFGHKACILNNTSACFGLGLKKLESKKYQEALKLFNRSCALNEGMGCWQSGEIVRAKSLPSSIKYFERGCNIGDLPSCLTLTQIFSSNLEKKGFYSMLACVLNDMESCFSWGQYLIHTKDNPLAKRILKIACEKGYQKSCDLGVKF